MVRRSTLVVVILFGLLVILAWYVQKNSTGGTEDDVMTSTPMPALFQISEDELSRVQVGSTEDGQLILEKNAQGEWNMVEPSGYETDQDKASSLVNNLLSLTVLNRLETDVSLDVLGLDAPSYRVILKESNGETQTMVIGNITPTDSGYYVKLGEQNPIVVSKTNLGSILEAIDDPPIKITETPTSETQLTETQIPENTPTP